MRSLEKWRITDGPQKKKAFCRQNRETYMQKEGTTVQWLSLAVTVTAAEAACATRMHSPVPFEQRHKMVTHDKEDRFLAEQRQRSNCSV